MSRPPLPPFTESTAIQKVRAAEDGSDDAVNGDRAERRGSSGFRDGHFSVSCPGGPKAGSGPSRRRRWGNR